MTVELEQVEVSRAMHQEGMEAWTLADYATVVHPIGALAVVHNILKIGAGEADENFSAAYGILLDRLQKPGALVRRLGVLQSLNRAFTIAATYDLKVSQDAWYPAMDLIKLPIEEAELAKHLHS